MILFVNDIIDEVTGLNVNMKLFADDVKLYSVVNEVNDLIAACNRITEWAKIWQMQIAVDKCSVLRLTNSRSISLPVYTLAGIQLSIVNEMRDLGVVIDAKLNFNSHISNIVHKAHVRARLILRSFASRDPTVLLRAFSTYVRPLLEYCSSVWNPLTLGNIRKLESVQRQFTKRFNGLTSMSYSDRLGHLSIESLQLRRLRHDLIILYKLIHGCFDISASDFLTMSHLVTTRGHKFKLSVQYSSVNTHKYHFPNRIINVWNCLPTHVAEASSVSCFVRQLDTVDLSLFCIDTD